MTIKPKIKNNIVKVFNSNTCVFCKKIIDDYYKDSYIDKKHGRELSWDKCHNTFKKYLNQCVITPYDLDYLELVLANYLASYGMYRNSPLLTDFCYSIHCDAIKIIFKKEYRDLLDFVPNSSNYDDYNILMFGGYINNRNKIEGIYNELYEFYNKTVGLKNPILLVTKVLLGTLCCIPALDNYFNKGMTILLPQDLTFTSKNHVLCETLHKFYINNNIVLRGKKFPPMKCIDIIFNLIGYKYS